MKKIIAVLFLITPLMHAMDVMDRFDMLGNFDPSSIQGRQKRGHHPKLEKVRLIKKAILKNNLKKLIKLNEKEPVLSIIMPLTQNKTIQDFMLENYSKLSKVMKMIAVHPHELDRLTLANKAKPIIW